ncbi:fatty acyl-CoA reductase 1-like [Trichogramma pretiosum]|uniref:fatty acyl-CoA reductase 1-like n=1 Tax=Trichogramma pretiosum TaxID=7493 RepID=UPI000C71BF3B|nr:fatty acyl-CoA reductase 1-like [Trichogramma pretiosum]
MSVVDAIYQRMRDDTEIQAQETGESELAKFYSGLNVLVTGPSDMLGKCLVEKLLFDCSDLNTIYLLVRTKRGEDFHEKCKQFFGDDVFSRLRRSQPDFRKKIKAVKGDLSLDKLGLGDEDYELLRENVDIILHNGADTRLNGPVHESLRANVLGTQRMLDLAAGCKHLKLFVQVSSAYAHCPWRVVEEVFYPAPADTRAVEDMIAADSETASGLTRDALDMLLGDWPNVFVFGKAIAEDLVQRHALRAPYTCCVFRPSLVISTYKEPIPGWCDHNNGPASFFLKIAKGAIHVVYQSEYPLDLVPADLCANALLVSAWDAIDRWQTEPGASVYNFGSSTEKPITMRQIKDKMMEDPQAFATSNARRAPYVMMTGNMIVYLVLRFIFDYVPAFLIDLLTLLHGHPAQAWNLVRSSMTDMCRLVRLANGNYRVRVTESLKAYERLNERDRALFFSDVRQLDWDDYFLTYWRGIRAHVLRESTDGPSSASFGCPFAAGRGSSSSSSSSSSSACPLGWAGSSSSCGRCPCKCPCKCVCLLAALALLAYYLVGLLWR